MKDYDAALEIAEFHNVIPVFDLVHWSENYGWNNASNPLNAFYAIAQLEDYYGEIQPSASYGFYELDLIGKALSCYATRPNDVEQFLEKLAAFESEDEDE